MQKFKPLLFYGIVIVLTFIAIRPLTQPGFFPIHDDEQVGRLYEMHQDVISGHLPPRLSPNLGFGYDYPLFNFYPSFVYYIAEVFHLFGFGYIVSIKLMIALGFILAAVWMYALTKEFFGRTAGIISAVLYTYASYHSIDVYVRGALPEFWSYVFLPAIFWAYTRLSRSINAIWTVTAGVLIACFILTHDLLAMMSAPFIFAFLIYLLCFIKERKRFIISVILSGMIGLCLSAYFWLPAVLEKKFTMVSLLTKELADYAIHFVYPVQFWFSPWGYGGSVAGMADGLSFQIGKVYILCLIAASIYAFFLIRKNSKTALLIFLMLGLFVFSLFMQTDYSKFIWDSLQSVMAYIQFPWRFMVFSYFCASFVIGSLFMQPLPFMRKKWVEYVQYVLGIVVVVLVMRTGSTIFRPSSYLTNVQDNDYVNEQTIKWKTSSLAFEYTPAGIATVKSFRGNTVVAIAENQIEHTPFSIIKGRMTVQTTKDIPQEKSAIVQAANNGMLQINVYSFPGWKVSVDNKPVTYSPDNPLRLLRIPLTNGTHTITATFTDTPVRLLGNILSIIALFSILSVLVLHTFYKHKKRKK